MSGVELAGVERLSDVLTAEYLEEFRLLPIEREEGGVLVGHAGEPDPQALTEIGGVFHAPVRLVPVPEEELLDAVRRIYGNSGSAAKLLETLEGASGPVEEPSVHDLQGLANQPPVVRLVNLLLSEAVEARASDVHLESTRSGLEVRYRIDGVLEDAPHPPPEMRAAVISRIKVMAELDIAERRIPQDGRVQARVGGRDLDIRVSTLPTLHGESVVLRLLDATHRELGLHSLGLAEDTRSSLEALCQRSQGMILATGPTGSGKTTTLYSLLQRIATGHEKVVSVEDPVEYAVDRVTQVPVRAKGGLTFARALRSILRQDPDVILVGEMRDLETAGICVQAALTGHLVLSTLHTNDAPSALTRLVELGVPDYLVTSTVHAVLAQRLVRKVCTDCAEETQASPEVERAMSGSPSAVDMVLRGRGCPACRGTGYRGRSGLYELLELDDEIRKAVLAAPDAVGIRQVAVAHGMRTLREDGWRQVAAGVTTPEEVLRVTSL
jgi:general secretion pathway protein E